MQNAPIRATGKAMPVAIDFTLPKSSIRLNIVTLADGRTVMLGRAGSIGR